MRKDSPQKGREFVSSVRNLRVSHLKLNRVALAVMDQFKSSNVLLILEKLFPMAGKVPGFIFDAIHSAKANAVNNFSADPQNLFVSRLLVNQGLVLKRFQPKGRGRIHAIRKRFCHIRVELLEVGKN